AAVAARGSGHRARRPRPGACGDPGRLPGRRAGATADRHLARLTPGRRAWRRPDSPTVQGRCRQAGQDRAGSGPGAGRTARLGADGRRRHASAGGQVRDPVAAQVDEGVGLHVAGQVLALLRDQGVDSIPRAWSWVVLGQHEAGELSYLGRRRTVGNRARGSGAAAWPDAGRPRGRLVVAVRAGVILTERPRALRRDAQGRLHHPEGPAITYADGFGVWAWHGVRVPRDVIEQPQALTVRRIHHEEDIEVRRVMLDRYGHDRYLRDTAAQRVHADELGTLWRSE